MKERTCEACGEPYTAAARANAKTTCSESCRVWLHNNPGKRRSPRQTRCARCDGPLLECRRRYCSSACSTTPSQLNQTERTCVVCGSSFIPLAANQKCCPPSDAERAAARARGAIQARSSCARAYSNALHRGTLDDLLARNRRPGEPFDCAACGRACVPGENVAPHATKFCDRACLKAWHKPLEVAAAQRRARRRRAERKLERAAQGIGTRRRRWVQAICPICESPFVHSARRPTTFCSLPCRTKSLRRRVRRRRRAKYGSDSHRSRARRFGVTYEVVDIARVFDRDGYRCGICRRLTKRTAKVPHPRAPTLDHVVPMSKGGDHTYANVQCACFECNWRKRDGSAGEQLRLVG